jgi:ribosomal protein S18 acetylase RimI-like enzyme
VSVEVWERPDGRRFVFGDSDDLPDGELYVSVREGDEERWIARGFAVWRREDEIEVPTVPASPHDFLALGDVDEDRLRLLDDELRQDTPGSDGWVWPAEDFHDETYDAPSIYLVAADYAGICRVWLDKSPPRLGFVGVRREHRREGLARKLVTAALGQAAALGHERVTAEVDEANAASQALFRSFGARRIGGFVELVRPRL